ncbi:MAG: hypothetical protein IJ528_06875 [Bacteroidaceae bacterium]|nr:hypothetical protein [Bacteroidaceae bacterium]
MKKYNRPQTNESPINISAIMVTVSGVVGNNMNYGGIDENGDQVMEIKLYGWEEI